MREDCATVMQALASIRSVEEIEGFIWGLRSAEGVKPVTQDEWAAIARRKTELMKKGVRH